MELSKELEETIRDYIDEFDCNHTEIIKETICYFYELKNLLKEKTVDAAKKQANRETEKRSSIVEKNTFYLTLAKNYLIMSYAAFRDYLVNENDSIGDIKKNMLTTSKTRI